MGGEALGLLGGTRDSGTRTDRVNGRHIGIRDLIVCRVDVGTHCVPRQPVQIFLVIGDPLPA